LEITQRVNLLMCREKTRRWLSFGIPDFNL